MVKEIILEQAGESVAAPLPKEVADRFRLAGGDRVLVIETEHGVLITPYDADSEAAMLAFEEVRGAYRDTLQRLT